MKEYILYVRHGFGHGLHFKYSLKENILEAFKIIQKRWKNTHYGSLVPRPEQFFILDKERKEICGIDNSKDHELIYSCYCVAGFNRISVE